MYTYWKGKETNSGAIIEVFDWNTGQIKFTTNPGGSGGVNWSPKFNAKSYSKFKVEIYGIGKRGSKYRGKRIEFED